VTGPAGFLGSHIVYQLLQSGCAVRGIRVCRTYKAEYLKDDFKHPDFEVVITDDLIACDYSDALVGVSSIVHVASPVPVPGVKENFIKLAVEGTLNILRQAQATQITKIVIIGTFGSALPNLLNDLLDPARVISHEHWNRLSEKDVYECSPEMLPMIAYMTSKVLAERAAWNFVEKHPEMDLITLLPTTVYGPLAPTHVVKDPSTMLSTNAWIYALLSGPSGFYPPLPHPFSVDARDVAIATVRALKAPPSNGEQRRILLNGGTISLRQAVQHLGKSRPELRSRLLENGEPFYIEENTFDVAKVDLSMAERVLGMTSFIPLQKTIEDTADSLVEKERMWLK
ncbi:hypothetical protein M422DRAFT_172737, partial [Sphaerobolus stellatus SS14]